MSRPLFKRLMPWLIRISLSVGIALLVIVFVQDAVFEFHFFDRLKLSFIDKSFAKRGSFPFRRIHSISLS